MKSRSRGAIAVILVAAVGALALTCFRFLAFEAVYPAERAGCGFARVVWSRVRGAIGGAAAGAENVRLRREVASLSLLRGTVERLEQENARLRRGLGYAARIPERWVAAAVLSSGGAASSRHALRVDKGSLAGVREGAVVTVPAGLVGRVVSVTPHTAEVLLVTDPSLKVACEIGESEGTPLRGILCGGDEDALELRHISGGRKVPLRARVRTSGRGGVFPRGIEVGTLVDLRKDARGLAHEGEVLPAVDFSALEDVFIRREE